MVITVVTIVLWTSLFSLFLLSLLSGCLIVYLCLHSLIVLSVDTLLFSVMYCPMCRTIAQTCISSVVCTPWYCSSLNCSARLVVLLLPIYQFSQLLCQTFCHCSNLLDHCCVYHTHLANTMWVSTHTPMLFITICFYFLSCCQGLAEPWDAQCEPGYCGCNGVNDSVVKGSEEGVAAQTRQKMRGNNGLQEKD